MEEQIQANLKGDHSQEDPKMARRKQRQLKRLSTRDEQQLGYEMEALLFDDKFLASQAIYRISGCLKCSLCKECKDIEKHISECHHARMLQKFQAHFTSSGTQLICTLCCKCVDWIEVKSHLALHGVMPWYKPGYIYERLFAEGTWKFKGVFYCWICGELSGKYWYEALEHCDLESHVERLEGRIMWPTGESKTGEKQYEKWISKGFTPDQDDGLVCQLCKVTVERTDAREHSTSSKHTTNNKSIGQNVLKREKCARVARQVSETSSCKGSTISCKDSRSSDNFTLFCGIATPPSEVATPFCKDSALFCDNLTTLCNDSALRNAAMPSHQVAALCNDSAPFCEDIALRNDAMPLREVSTLFNDDATPTCVTSAPCCQNGESLDNLSVATTTPSCALLDSKATRLRHDDPDSPNDFDALTFLTDPCTINLKKKLKGFKFYCVICVDPLRDIVSARNHVSGQLHAVSMKKYGCQSIVQSADGYYCKCCDQEINLISLVYSHVLEKEHRFRFQSSFAESKISGPPINGSETSISSINGRSEEVVSSTSSPSRDDRYAADSTKNTEISEFPFVVGFHTTKLCKTWGKKLNDEHSLYCVICDEKIRDVRNGRGHVSSPRHVYSLKKYKCEEIVKIENGYYCKCCNHAIGTLTAAYRHVKKQGHTHRLQDKLPELCEKAVNAPPSCQIIIEPTPSCKDIEEATLSCEKIVKAGPSCEKIVQATPSCEKIVDATPPCEKIEEATSCESESSSTGKSSELSVPHIIRLGKNKNACLICSRKRCHTFDNVQVHVQGRRHQFALKELGCAMAPTQENDGRVNSETENNEVTRPTSCNLEVGSLENGYPPINGFYHSRSIKVKRDIEKTESLPRYGNPATPWNSLYDYIAVKMDGPAPETLIEDAYQTDTSKEPKVMKKRTWREITKIKTTCNICGSVVPDFTSLHCHLAMHLSDYFVSAAKNNSLAVEPCNFDLEEDCDSNNDGTNDSQCPPIELLTLNEGKTTRTAYKINLRKTLALLNFNDDIIYEMVDKTTECELCSKLWMIVDASTAYCLVCRETVSNAFQSFYDHLNSLGHCTYLDMMENDAARFSGYSGQFSDLDLGLEYMEEKSDDWVICYACAVSVTNETAALREHIFREDHTRSRTKLHTYAMRTADLLKSRFSCDWYCVNHYWCVPCRTTFVDEVTFVAHLKSPGHSKTTKKFGGKTLLLDFCPDCALLWYGFRVTRFYHELTADHVVSVRVGYNVNRPMSKFAMRLLTKPEAYADLRIRRLNDIAAIESSKQRILLEQLEKIIRCKFPRAKAYTFGSRIAGLGAENSDLDIFVDCGNAYDGYLAVSVMTYFIEGVYSCLCKHPNEWGVDELLQHCKIPIIRVYHRQTDLKCDLSFEHGLGVENTSMIRKYCDVYPPCRKLIITLKQWLVHCNLADARAIKSYTLSWLVIFYLQSMWILPSVNTLVKMKNKSRIIGGWEVGASHDFTYYEADLGVDNSANLFVHLLKGFFSFYAQFDFRRDVVCPLLGQPVYKIAFIKTEGLPKEMEPYLQYLRESSKKTMFAMDAPMCVQDPFRLNDNLTKAVGKRHLNIFRIRCAESLNFLQQREAYTS